MLDKTRLAVARQPANPPVKPSGARVSQLLAYVVELAVEPGHGPADPRRGSRRGRNLARARTAAVQRALAQGNHEQLLVWREGHPADCHLSQTSLLDRVRGDRDEGRI